MLVVVVLKVLPVPVLIVLRCTGGLVHLCLWASPIKRLKLKRLAFQEEKPGKESRPVGNVEESNGWIANLVISTRNPCNTVNM